ncbi:MAG: CDP-glycerol glycerophosphotransferase family protein, partial [Actinomycetes bacterium]
FPEGTETVTYRSPECRAALEAADVVLANTHTDMEWDKGPDILYLQTWHGTPLKRIHWDVRWAPEGRLERLQRDVDRWDVLLSPSAAATPFLRRAFRYDREVVETGYPRNDILSRPGRDEVRARVRQELGIEDRQTAVLYTPTWRDDMVFDAGGREFALGLDVDAVTAELGEDHVLLLRLHYMVSAGAAAVKGDAVREVSRHPDVSELYLAADVMVTDYSSTMFDFAITGRPMLFFTYDLEDYAERLRGFYFDLAAEAPGPMVETPGALLDALRDLDAIGGRYGDRYERFREKFCALEDGRATDRLIERVLAGR